ncbi:MAG: GNAT family acetyltransferase [Micropruina sp.]
MSQQIIELGADEADEAVSLWRSVGLTRPWNDPKADFLRAVGEPSSAVLGLRDAQGSLIGTAMVGDDGHRGWVYYLAVSAEQRDNGLGRHLMQACEEWLTARGAPKIQFMVRKSNKQVLAFYAHLGYEVQECAVLGRRLS